MGLSKPFHRTYRAMKAGPNSGYSGWAYIHDREYARDAEHYVRPLMIIQRDLQDVFEYIEPSEECRLAYSYRIHALFVRTCIEIEANFKAILNENIFHHPKGKPLNMGDYRKIDFTHHLSSYEVMLPIWNPEPLILKPFKEWGDSGGKSSASSFSISWFKAYNASKHDRHQEFKKSNFENLINSVAGLLVVISSQFRDCDFSSGPTRISLNTGNEYHSMKPSIGSLFRIKYPDDWSEDELYDFNWENLKGDVDRFSKIDYNSI